MDSTKFSELNKRINKINQGLNTLLDLADEGKVNEVFFEEFLKYIEIRIDTW